MTKEQEKTVADFTTLLNAQEHDDRLNLLAKVSEGFCHHCGRTLFREEGDVTCNCWRDE